MNAEQERDYYARIALPRPQFAPDCVGCGGAGYVRYERAPGHPLFGQCTTCRKCHPTVAVEQPVEEEKWWAK